jgi:hypothetical protein
VEPTTGQIVIMNGISHDVVFADQFRRSAGRLALDGEPGTPVPNGHGLIFTAISDHNEISVIDRDAKSSSNSAATMRRRVRYALDSATGVLLVTAANLK